MSFLAGLMDLPYSLSTFGTQPDGRIATTWTITALPSAFNKKGEDRNSCIGASYQVITGVIAVLS
jgi:hypothetical protein